MKHHLLLIFCFLLLLFSAPLSFAGRQPCDRGAGGIAYCSGDKFVCGNGKISGSKKTCDPKIHGTTPKSQEKKPGKSAK